MHCACYNPMWKALDDTLFNKDTYKKLEQQLAKVSKSEDSIEMAAIMYSGGIIRPMIDGKTGELLPGKGKGDGSRD